MSAHFIDQFIDCLQPHLTSAPAREINGPFPSIVAVCLGFEVNLFCSTIEREMTLIYIRTRNSFSFE